MVEQIQLMLQNALLDLSVRNALEEIVMLAHVDVLLSFCWTYSAILDH